ncbi:MAG: hypothetical protein Q7T44_17690 [Parvibaculum sp.]|nr:hypothetical protein [Parvibaculum sp.]
MTEFPQDLQDDSKALFAKIQKNFAKTQKNLDSCSAPAEKAHSALVESSAIAENIQAMLPAAIAGLERRKQRIYNETVTKTFVGEIDRSITPLIWQLENSLASFRKQ